MRMGAAVELAENRYGKSRVRLMKVVRGPERNTISDWTVELLLEGEFAAVYALGDNGALMATDTMKNTVYSVARASTAETMEAFATELVGYLLGRNPQVTTAEVSVQSALWKRLQIDKADDGFSFMRGSNEQQTTRVRQGQGGTVTICSGLKDMVVLKTSQSGFAGFLRDELTTLPETDDRLLGTAVCANWTYVTTPDRFDRARETLREAMLRAFAEHDSKSVQHTLFAMGEAALGAVAEIDAINLLMPNRHYLPVDLARFGQDNPNMIFVPTEEPHGTIEARVRRKR